jgi:hypothetical protein
MINFELHRTLFDNDMVGIPKIWTGKLFVHRKTLIVSHLNSMAYAPSALIL